MPATFEIGASVLLWKGREILVMKREPGSFAGGGWFIPGGHLEAGETPPAACAREVVEETGIPIDPVSLSLADVMTYQTGETSAHIVIYNAGFPEGAEVKLNAEHLAARWMKPEAYIARFLDSEMLRGRGIGEREVALAEEVARTIRVAASRWLRG